MVADPNDQPLQGDDPYDTGTEEVDQAEGERVPGELDTKVDRNPDQAEGDREEIEEDLEAKTGNPT